MIFENKKEIDEILYNKCSCVCEEMKTKIKEIKIVKITEKKTMRR